MKNPTPLALGYHMPAEWEKHEATWLAWPHNSIDWPDKVDSVRWAYGEMIRHIAPGEKVRLFVNNRTEETGARQLLSRVGCDLRQIEFILHPTDRSWMRDTGPTFVRRGRSAETAIVHFHFNAWAKPKVDWRKDRKNPEVAARLLRKKLFRAEHAGRPFVLEGGGIEVNGRGTLLTTEQCYLDPTVQVRNPGLTRADYEKAFRKYLGVKNVFWLAAGPTGDDTHGHVDDICRFVDARTLVMIKETNRRDLNYRPLAANWERIRELRLEGGRKPKIIPLPMPAPLYFNSSRLPASYANFYIANAVVLVPTFNDPNDRVALGILADLFPDRRVVGIHAVDLVLGRGAVHCLTQQQPAA